MLGVGTWALLLNGVAARAAPDFEYPELLVTPRTSERLEREANAEARGRWTVNLPIQVSAALTFTTALIHSGTLDVNRDPNKRSALAGEVVGGAWIVATVALSAFYRPYSSGWEEVGPMPARSKREQLSRERLAEEAIERPARLSRRLSILSAATNFAAAVYMANYSGKGTLGVPATIVSAIAAFVPIVFPYHWQTVANDQREYKKRIYGPIASAAVFPEPGTGRAAPGLALALRW